jgi:hypothetical protein
MNSVAPAVLFAAVAFAAPSLAQTLQLSAAAPIRQSIDTATAVLFSGTMPSGAMAASGGATIGQPGETTEIFWSSEQSAAGMSFSAHWGVAISTAGLTASLQNQGMLLALSTPATTSVVLELTGENWAFVGAAPTLRIDVGDDGVFELTEQITSATVPIVLGPTPIMIRVTIAATQVGSGSSFLGLYCRPDNAATVTSWNIGCGNVPFGASPTFDGNFMIGAWVVQNHPVLGVLSVNLHGIFLGTSSGLPCVLVPAPDVLLPFVASADLPITVPASLRPFVFFGQGVGIDQGRIITGRAFVAQAN